MDDKIVPCAVVNDHVAAFASSRRLAEQVLAEQPLVAPSGALSDDDAARAVVAGFNWAELVSAVEPWVMYGIRQDGGDAGAANDPADDPPHVKELCSQVKTGFQILKCLRGAWSETRHEGDAWVTHSVTVFEDLAD
jgi:hypothetical protein